jgi:hypothetical protein
METPKEYYYTYYSYEEWGRGYFGSRGCKCLPEEDVRYFGSFKDKTFKPTQKIILKADYATREEAYADEIILHDYYDVANNPHFANKAKTTSTGFYISKELARKIGKINGKIAGKKTKKFKLGIFSLTPEQNSQNGKLGGSIGGKTVGKMNKELGRGIFGMSESDKIESCRKGGQTTNSQRWKCLETGYVSTAAGIVIYQRSRGIDTSKKNRVKIE